MTSICDVQSMLTAANGSGNDGALAKKQRSQKGASDHSLSGLDRVEQGALLEALGQADERSERLRRLKEKIDGGRYFVASGELAERMMAFMMAD
jgi:anti-sigma28 factor (negative regulator of flagellin synthesis)